MVIFTPTRSTEIWRSLVSVLEHCTRFVDIYDSHSRLQSSDRSRKSRLNLRAGAANAGPDGRGSGSRPNFWKHIVRRSLNNPNDPTGKTALQARACLTPAEPAPFHAGSYMGMQEPVFWRAILAAVLSTDRPDSPHPRPSYGPGPRYGIKIT